MTRVADMYSTAIHPKIDWDGQYNENGANPMKIDFPHAPAVDEKNSLLRKVVARSRRERIIAQMNGVAASLKGTGMAIGAPS